MHRSFVGIPTLREASQPRDSRPRCPHRSFRELSSLRNQVAQHAFPLSRDGLVNYDSANMPSRTRGAETRFWRPCPVRYGGRQINPKARPPPGHLEKEEARLWRLALAFLVLLATGLAALSWERLARPSLSPGSDFHRTSGPGDPVRRLRLRPPPRSLRTEAPARRSARSRRSHSFRRATRPAEPGHSALAAKLQGAHRFV